MHRKVTGDKTCDSDCGISGVAVYDQPITGARENSAASSCLGKSVEEDIGCSRHYRENLSRGVNITPES